MAYYKIESPLDWEYKVKLRHATLQTPLLYLSCS